MNNSNKTKLNQKPGTAQAKAEPAAPKAETIKLGVDVHLDRYVVVRIVEGGTPQPPQRFGPPEFQLWVAKQITLAEKVITCYEAGGKHRADRAALNFGVRPKGFVSRHPSMEGGNRSS
jgi:hypothetical protein